MLGAVWVKDQNRAGTRKMFRLGRRACQNHQALAFDEDLLVQDLRVTWHSEGVSGIIVKNPCSLFIWSNIFGFMLGNCVWGKDKWPVSWNVHGGGGRVFTLFVFIIRYFYLEFIFFHLDLQVASGLEYFLTYNIHSTSVQVARYSQSAQVLL